MGSKKKNPFLSFIKGLFIFLLIIVLILGLWCGFSALHKKSFLSLLPTDFSLYLHTDSVWGITTRNFWRVVNPKGQVRTQ